MINRNSFYKIFNLKLHFMLNTMTTKILNIKKQKYFKITEVGTAT